MEHELCNYKRINIKDIYRSDDYTFVYLDNEQKLLVKDKKIYDISCYSSFHKVITMNNIDYAVVIKDNTLHLINLETKDVIFKDFKAYDINKLDEKCLKIIMKIGGGDDAIYNVETKEYLSIPTDYEFEISRVIFELLDKLYNPNVLYRSTGVILDGITHNSEAQLFLFNDADDDKKARLTKCFDRLESRFGKDVIRTGFTPD